MLYKTPPRKHQNTRSLRSLRNSKAAVFDAWRDGEETVLIYQVKEDAGTHYYQGKLGGSQFERVTRCD